MSGPGPGHNGGPTMEAGYTWRRQSWTRARAALLPAMPLEVVRYRMKRASELGLDYKTYAGVRASTGRDIVAVLFSSNALRLRRAETIPAEETAKLTRIADCRRLAAIHLPLDPARVLMVNADALDDATRAPNLFDSWSATRARLLEMTRAAKIPADAVLVVGETPLERDWSATARMAGFLHADRYFERPTP